MRSKLLLMWLCFGLVSAVTADEATIKFSVVQQQGAAVIKADGLPESTLSSIGDHITKGGSASDFLRLYVANKQGQRDAGTPAVMGTCSLDGKSIVFHPKYPLTPGLAYVAELSTSGTSVSIARGLISLPALVFEPSTRVTAIYPTADKLPENLLKFYIHFSAPMSGGEVYRHVEVVELGGKQLEHPFLEVAEELWDPSGKRLTLILDPARVKRGLVPREEDGPILYAGKKYRLTVKDTWEDSRGAKLVSQTVKEFEVLPPDHTSPQPAQWKISPPQTGGSQQLVIDLGESLDHALVTRCMVVVDSKGKPVEGAIALSKHESVWSFTPDSPWQPGDYELKIDDIIEDLAGNSIAKPFEVDRFDTIQAPIPKHVRLTFRIPALK